MFFDSQFPKWTGKAVYMIRIAKEIKIKEDIEKALKLEFSRLEEPIHSYKEYIGRKEYRAYKFIPSKVWITDDIKDKKGNTIDHRTELAIQNLAEQ